MSSAELRKRFPDAETDGSDLLLRVERDAWVATVAELRDQLGLDWFDFLTAVDEAEEGFDVVARLWGVDARVGVRLVVRCPRDEARVPSLASLYAGAAWHERHAAEMFGIAFDGHPSPGRLLLPPALDGTPLRKEFLLASRLAAPWPGAKEPGEGDADLDQPGRRRVPQPPGVPEGWRP